MLKTGHTEALRSSEDRYLKIVDELQDYAVLLLDTDGIIQNWNKGAEKIKGYKRDEIIGKNFRMFYTKQDVEKGLPEILLAESIKNGRVEHEGWRVRKDGTHFWGNVIITSLHDENNVVTGFLKVTRDLTERKRSDENLRLYMLELEESNEALKESERRFHGMVEEVQDYAIILLDNDGIIQNWNKGAQRIKGYMPNEIIGKIILAYMGKLVNWLISCRF